MDKLFTLATTKRVDPQKREITGWASREVIDRDNELILAKAWQHDDSLRDFLLSPVLMPMHKYDQLPLGRVLEIKALKEGLWFRAKFANTEAAKEAFKFICDMEGLASFSVGFQPISSEERTVARLNAIGIDTGARRLTERIKTYDHVRLLEISLAPIPSNPLCTALGAAYSGGKIKTKELQAAMEDWEITIEPDEPKQSIPLSKIEVAVKQAVERVLGSDTGAKIITESVEQTKSDLREKLGVNKEEEEVEVKITDAELTKKIDDAMIKVLSKKFTVENLRKKIREAVDIQIKKSKGIVE